MFRDKKPREIIETLSIKIYEPPLSTLRDRLSELPEVVRVVILLIDFDTEVTMQGILGFLENSTGLYLPETIQAFATIGANETAQVLRRIQAIMAKHGVSPSRLREDFAEVEQYQITSFAELHGEQLEPMTEEIDQEAEKLYLYAEHGEGVFSLLEDYVKNHRGELIKALNDSLA